MTLGTELLHKSLGSGWVAAWQGGPPQLRTHPLPRGGTDLMPRRTGSCQVVLTSCHAYRLMPRGTDPMPRGTDLMPRRTDLLHRVCRVQVICTLTSVGVMKGDQKETVLKGDQKEMQFSQIRDRVEIDSETIGMMDVSGLPGTWINSNPDTSGIARLAISESNGMLTLRAYAVGPDGLIDWGTTEINVFAASPVSRAGAGFTCIFDFGFAETELQAMIMKGLLVLAQLHRFKDDSRRVDYFVREYFALEHERY